jgi:hypothetical protein
MRRLILALVVGAGLFGVVFAAAATLNIGSTGNLQAGQSLVGQCQGTTPVNISYVIGPSSALPSGYAVTAVTFTNIQLACNGKTLQMSLLNATGGTLTTATFTLPATATAPYSITAGSLNVDAGQVSSASVAILN